MAFDHPILSAWLCDPETRDALAFETELAAMVGFEVALAQAQSEQRLIPDGAAQEISRAARQFAPDMDDLRRSMARDGVVVPGLLRQLRATMGECSAYLHFGATSQDVIDTALMMRLSSLLPAYAQRLGGLADRLAALGEARGHRPLMAVTRMRDALPITLGDRIATWTRGIAAARTGIEDAAKREMALQLAGPVGTLEKFGAAGPELRARLADRLSLVDPGMPWHTERGRLLRIAASLAATTNALGKFGADIALMAQDGTAKVVLEGGASSSMAHKVNPVDAELLVALSGYAGAQLGAVGQAGLHVSERAGPAWTFEWLAFPQLLHSTGGALQAAERLAGAIREIG